MKKKFILPRRFFAFALAFAMTFTSFPPLSVHAEGDEEIVQETGNEEEQRDDCCNHEAEEAARIAAEQASTETPVIEETLPQVEAIPEVKEDPVVESSKKMMMLAGANSNGGKDPESCNHPKGQCQTTTLEPDCGNDGYVEVFCYKCNSVVSHNVLLATGEHSYDNGVITTEPTCTNKGVKTFTCNVCNNTRTEEVAPIGHASVEVPAKATSCTEEGMTAGHKCSVCGTILDGCQPIPMSDHNYEEVGEVKPTCTADGHTAGTKCSVCGKVLSGCEVLEKTEHHFEAIEQSDPFCGREDGHIKYECTICEYSYDELIECKLVHDFEDIPEKEATCTEDGCSAYQKCKNCGYIPVQPTMTPALGGEHTFTLDKVLKPATCKEAGECEYKCSKCGFVKTGVIPQKEHEYGEEYPVVTKQVTCGEAGKVDIYKDCQYCGYQCLVFKNRVINPTGHHIYGTEMVVIQEPTCTVYEYRARVCEVCGARKDITQFDKLGHKFENYVPNGDATCLSVGTMTATCSREGCSETDTIAGTELGDHVWENDYTVDKEQTCTEDGSKSIHCSLCDAKKEITPITHTGHNLEWVTIKEPTCTEKGSHKQVCKNEGCTYETEPSDIPTLEHNFSIVKEVVEPTCTEDGYTVYKCSRCEETENRDTVTNIGHQFGEWYVAEEATCKNAGLKRRDCTKCSHYETEVIPKEENHKYVFSKKVAPTCTEQGYDLALCKWCNKERRQHLVDPLGHDFSLVREIVKPTCLKDGYTVYKCSRCEETENRNIISKLGHEYGEWKVTKEPTCKDLGSKRRDCIHEGCNSFQTQAIPVVNHSFTEVKEVVKPTCTERGYTVYKCKWCEETEIRDYVDALDHDFEEEWQVETPATCEKNGTQIKRCRRPGCTWVTRTIIPKTGHVYEEEWKVIKEPTCQELGVKAKYCKNEGCHNYLSNAINKVGHSFTEVKEVVKPTCTERGYTVYKCKWCEETEIRDYVDALDHDFEEEWQVETPATCEKNGTQIKRCRRPGCTWVQRTIIPKSGHDYEEEWKVIKEPTCQELGVKAKYCKNEGCNKYLSNAINKVGHSFTVPQKTVKPTCTEQGYTVYKCKWCEETEIRDYVDPLNHDYDDWFIVTDPTCQADGEERHDCKNCEAYETRPIAKLDHHVFSEFVKKVEPTCTADGYTTYKCTWCDETEDRDTVAAKGHDFDDWYTVTDPTCQIEGESRRDCKNCEHFETKPIEKADHAYNKFVKAVAPTCESKGYSVYKCQWCEKTETRDYVDALGHKHVTDPGKSATCTSDGYTEKEYCSRCGKVFDDSDIIKATGHNWGPETFENFVFPTTISLGGYDSVRYCWNCGCKHSVHVTLPMISFVPTTPVKPLPKPITPVVPKPSPIVPKDDPFDIIDRSDENDPGEVKENAEDVKDVEDTSDNADDSSKSEEVTGDESKDTSEIEVLDGNDNQKEIKTPDPKRRDENIVIDFSMYLIIGAIILLLILLTIFFIILAKRRKDSNEEEELK